MQSGGWKLVRAALVGIGAGDPPRVARFQLGSVEVVRTLIVRREDRGVGAVLVAHAPVSLNSAGDIDDVLRGEARRDAELAIETLARICAIDSRSTHTLSSVDPFVGLRSEYEDDLAQLEGRAVQWPVLVARHKVEAPSDILEAVDVRMLSDRLAGVALLAEALNSGSPLGRYSQFMRLFESAFRLGPSGLTTPLTEFLASSEHGFTAEEVTRWTDARAYAIHADRRSEVYLDSAVRLFEGRMLEAGYDLLFNKAKWRSKSTARREVWRAMGGTKGSESSIYLTKGKAASVGLQIFDGFMAYPMYLAGPFNRALPRAAWLMGGADHGRLQVLGDWTD